MRPIMSYRQFQSAKLHLLLGRCAVLHFVALQFSIELAWRLLPHHEHLCPIQHGTHVNWSIFWHYDTKINLRHLTLSTVLRIKSRSETSINREEYSPRVQWTVG